MSDSRYTPKEVKAIARRFRSFRERNLMTQRELGQFIGITRISICMIERGHRAPHYSTLRRFALLEQQERAATGKFMEIKKNLKPLERKYNHQRDTKPL